MRVMFACGGTGGHINPALAIAEEIKKHDPEAVIEFVGTPWGKENDLVVREGYVLRHVKMTGFSRSLSLSNLKTIHYTNTAPFVAGKYIRAFRPDVVIGTGGYTCYPTIRAAVFHGIPTILHESNAKPGLAVKLLQLEVSMILTNFSDTAKHLLTPASRIRQVGNPLRKAYGEYTKQEARALSGMPEGIRYWVVSCGGSGGAETVNRAVLDMMEKHLTKHPEIGLIHAAGKRDYEKVKEEFDRRGLDRYPNLILKDYIYDMPVQMTAADLVICRAGAMTLSEVALLHKPSVIIPSPYVADNHQFVNADALRKKGAASLLEEKNMNGDSLFEQVWTLLDSEELLGDMEDAVASFAFPNANEDIYEAIVSCVKNSAHWKRQQKKNNKK